MPPRREFAVDRDDDGARLESFLRRRLGLGRVVALKALRKGWVRLDGKRAAGDALLTIGQVVKITNYGLPLPAVDGPAAGAAEPGAPSHAIPPTILALARASVRHADRDLLVSAKPNGFVVHAGSGHAWGWIDALAQVLPRPEVAPQPIEDDGAPGAAPDVSGLVPIGRLDRDTSGLLAIARTRFAARALFAALRAGTLDRTYTALVAGALAGDQGTIDLPLEKAGDEGEERMEATPDGREARTRWRVARRLPNATLVTLELDTGRTHQLRAHLASQGHPILGDPRYSDDAARALARRLGVTRLCLHAGALRVPDPTCGQLRSWDEPLPAEMAKVVHALGR